MLPPRHPKILEFVAAAHKAGRHNLLQCSSGNLSFRLDENTALLSASRSWLGELKPEQVVVCDIDTQKTLNGLTPTVETAFHLGILKARPEVSAVLHFQTPCATAIACDSNMRDYNFNVLPEIPFYIKDIAFVDYLPPGSPELAQAVVDAMKTANLTIMKNHGQVTTADTLDHAIQNAAFFELACRILLTAPNPDPIPPSQIESLRNI